MTGDRARGRRGDYTSQKIRHCVLRLGADRRLSVCVCVCVLPRTSRRRQDCRGNAVLSHTPS
jgi:hypothetical protein